ncbi:MAG: hypothetical protein ABIN67_09840 [Ferruginibacter sp.]
MKKLTVLFSLAVAMLCSCGGGNTYTLETFYSSKSDGDTTMVTEKDNIYADSDSAAFVKAQDKFNSLMAKSGDKHGMPVKFTLRDHDGVVIVPPGMDSAGVEKQMYPAQKPSTGN